MQAGRIGFIGGGNMARSLIGGLIKGGDKCSNISVSDPSAEKLAELASTFGINTATDNQSLAESVDILVLAVKPQIMREIAEEIAPQVRTAKPLLISIAAGVREKDINRWVGGGAAIVRTMPNTPALVQSGATALYANEEVTPEQKDQAESVLRAVGITLWVSDETKLDTVTALSGSGPAYFFLIMEILEAAAIELGLDANDARLLTLETAFGASKMALSSGESPADLRNRVTSPGGTTEAALNVFANNNLGAIFKDALEAAQARGLELGKQLGDS